MLIFSSAITLNSKSCDLATALSSIYMEYSPPPCKYNSVNKNAELLLCSGIIIFIQNAIQLILFFIPPHKWRENEKYHMCIHGAVSTNSIFFIFGGRGRVFVFHCAFFFKLKCYFLFYGLAHSFVTAVLCHTNCLVSIHLQVIFFSVFVMLFLSITTGMTVVELKEERTVVSTFFTNTYHYFCYNMSYGP